MNGITITEAADLCGVTPYMFTTTALKHKIIPRSKRISWDSEITVEQWLDINDRLPLTDANGRLFKTPIAERKKPVGGYSTTFVRKRRQEAV
jgi:hypothetical protein